MARRLKTGFTAWVEQLARDHTRGLAALAAREGLSGEDAIDTVQEAFVTFLQLPQARSMSEVGEDVFAFLAVIVRNGARNARRRHHRAQPHVAIEDQAVADDGIAVDEWIERAEEHAALLGCVARLIEIQRHVVTLRLLEQLSTAEVASALALKPGTVAVTLHRAKAELQRCLADGEPLICRI